MSRYIPPSIRDKGLKQHLGAERYDEFDRRMRLKVPIAEIARAINVSRQQASKYRDIWVEEQRLQS